MWATPSGIDHDYNYLKSVERNVGRAGQDLVERGIGRRHNKASTNDKRLARAQAPGSALHSYLEKHDVRIEKAPVGMSRQKANRTRTTNRGKVMWTVEWIDGSGNRIVNHDNEAGRTLSELWNDTMSIKRNAESGVKRDRKRKRQPDMVAKRDPKPEEAIQHDEKPPKPEEPSDVTWPDEIQDAKPPLSVLRKDIWNGTTGDEAKVGTDETAHKGHQAHGGHQNNVKPLSLVTAAPPKNETSQHFYLLKPLTASKAKVVIPLDSAHTLTHCVAKRTILEFPTIFVLNEASNALPDGFMLDSSYEKIQEREQEEVEGLLQDAKRSGADGSMASGQDEKPLDAGSILDMLQRDIGL